MFQYPVIAVFGLNWLLPLLLPKLLCSLAYCVYSIIYNTIVYNLRYRSSALLCVQDCTCACKETQGFGSWNCRHGIVVSRAGSTGMVWTYTYQLFCRIRGTLPGRTVSHCQVWVIQHTWWLRQNIPTNTGSQRNSLKQACVCRIWQFSQ